jgi:hypothetical protein
MRSLNTQRDANEVARVFYEALHPTTSWFDIGHHEQLPWIDAAYDLLNRGQISVGKHMFVGVG